MSPSEAHALHLTPLLRRQLLGLKERSERSRLDSYLLSPDTTETGLMPIHTTKSYRMPLLNYEYLQVAKGLPELRAIASSAWSESCLSRQGFRWFVPPVVAPPISIYCTDRTFVERQAHSLESPSESLALYGLSPELRESEPAFTEYQRQVPVVPVAGLFSASPLNQLPLSTMQVPEAKRLIYDSAKLARLDALLQELKAGDHRVLVYFQMTRMMDLMEEYLIYRQYKYLRLDGSSKLEDRRDMVMEWQTR